MKTNNKKKVVVSVLALAMGAGLAGSISGSVAWYQYSTRTSALLAGTSAGTTRNLQISSNNGANWAQHIDLGTSTFRPASVYGEAGSLSFVDHPVYKTALLPAAAVKEGSVYKAEFSFVFKCEDNTGSGATQVAKDVYLTHLNIVGPTASQIEGGAKDVTPAVRIEIDGVNDFIVAKTAGDTITHGNLNLNGNKTTGGSPADILDKDGFDADDINGNLVDYKNAEATNEKPNLGQQYTSVAPSSVVVGSSDPYNFTDTTGRLLTSTLTEGNSAAVKVTVWLEGWQQFDGSSIWDVDYINQNFTIEMQFACQADR